MTRAQVSDMAERYPSILTLSPQDNIRPFVRLLVGEYKVPKARIVRMLMKRPSALSMKASRVQQAVRLLVDAGLDEKEAISATLESPRALSSEVGSRMKPSLESLDAILHAWEGSTDGAVSSAKSKGKRLARAVAKTPGVLGMDAEGNMEAVESVLRSHLFIIIILPKSVSFFFSGDEQLFLSFARHVWCDCDSSAFPNFLISSLAHLPALPLVAPQGAHVRPFAQGGRSRRLALPRHFGDQCRAEDWPGTGVDCGPNRGGRAGSDPEAGCQDDSQFTAALRAVTQRDAEAAGGVPALHRGNTAGEHGGRAVQGALPPHLSSAGHRREPRLPTARARYAARDCSAHGHAVPLDTTRLASSQDTADCSLPDGRGELSSRAISVLPVGIGGEHPSVQLSSSGQGHTAISKFVVSNLCAIALSSTTHQFRIEPCRQLIVRSFDDPSTPRALFSSPPRSAYRPPSLRRCSPHTRKWSCRRLTRRFARLSRGSPFRSISQTPRFACGQPSSLDLPTYP